MRCTILLVGVCACQSSSPPGEGSASKTAPALPLAIVGHGVQLVPAPSIGVAQLENGVLIFGPRADAAPQGQIKNAAVKPGKPPTGPLTPHVTGSVTMLSDGAADTTAVALGVGMTSYDGVLVSLTLSPHQGPWVIAVDGKDQAWTAGQRLSVEADGHTFRIDAK